MKLLFLSFVITLGGVAVCRASEATRALSHDDLRSFAQLRAASKPVQPEEATATAPAPRPAKMITGDATSSLSHAKAIDLAQRLAANIDGAAVADLSPEYTGKFSPAVPANAVFVIEPVTFAAAKAFDLVLFTDPAGALRCRQLLAKNEDTALVGFPFLDAGTHAQVAPKAIVGRVVATVIFDPSLQ